MKNVFVLFLCFTLLFVAFNPISFSSEFEFPTFFEIFDFGYTITFGTVDLMVSVFEGPEVFFQKFDAWRATIFGDVTLIGFLFSIVERHNAFLDSIAERIPVVRDIKHVIDTILLPFEEVVSDLIDWLSEKIG